MGAGRLQQDNQARPSNFRDSQLPRSINNNKGIVAGETWTINTHAVNDIRYGYIRQGYGNPESE